MSRSRDRSRAGMGSTEPRYATEFVVLRTPLLPVDTLPSRRVSLEAPRVWREAGAVLEEALRKDHLALAGEISHLVKRAEICDAFLFASPSVLDGLDAWIVERESPRASGMTEVLARYLARMSSRPTPFGLFAGISTGKVGEKTCLRLEGAGVNRPVLRPSPYALGRLAQLIEDDHAARDQLTYEINTTLYSCGDRIRYVERRFDSNLQEPEHVMSTVESTDILRDVLLLASTGKRRKELANALVAAHGVGVEDAIAYVDTLIENQILVSNLQPAVTGGDPIEDMIETLERAGLLDDATSLRSVRRTIDATGATGLGIGARGRNIAARLPRGNGEWDCELYAELHKPAPELTVGNALVDTVRRAIMQLHRSCPQREDAALSAFREAFTRRWGDAEVLLTDALDEERGVGFGAVKSRMAFSLLDDIELGASDGNTAERSFTARDDYMIRRVSSLLQAGETQWELSEDDLCAMETKGQFLPDAFAAIVSVAASAQATPERDMRVVVHGALGPSGMDVLGRFCHGDPALHAFVRRHLEREASLREDALFCEIVHMPPGRQGNVVVRPILRAHEIAYLGRCGVSRDRRIEISDLRVSVIDDQVILRSSRLDRRIIPRMTCAHGPALSDLAMYRFLVALQDSDAHGRLAWDWGALGGSAYLPRVVAGRATLALAAWNLHSREIASLRTRDRVSRYRAVQSIRELRRLPRLVSVGDGDRRLVLDLDSSIDAENLSRFVVDKQTLRVTEVLPNLDDCGVFGPEGRFANELVIPFVRTEPDTKKASWNVRPAAPSSFVPGSQWVYAKLYSGPATLDRILDVVWPALAGDGMAELTDRRFFIRYGDPDWHLRVRVRVRSKRDAHCIIDSIRESIAPMLDNGDLARLVLDTYQPEVSRYGGSLGVELSEQIFSADSDAVAALVQNEDVRNDADLRWMCALRGAHTLLNDFNFTARERVAMLERMATTQATLMNAPRGILNELAVRFRRKRIAFEEIICLPHERDPIVAPFSTRSAALEPLARQLHAACQRGTVTRTPAALVESYMHMFINRILAADHAGQELFLYDSLRRLYVSAEARTS